MWFICLRVLSLVCVSAFTFMQQYVWNLCPCDLTENILLPSCYISFFSLPLMHCHAALWHSFNNVSSLWLTICKTFCKQCQDFLRVFIMLLTVPDAPRCCDLEMRCGFTLCSLISVDERPSVHASLKSKSSINNQLSSVTASVTYTHTQTDRHCVCVCACRVDLGGDFRFSHCVSCLGLKENWEECFNWLSLYQAVVR